MGRKLGGGCLVIAHRTLTAEQKLAALEKLLHSTTFSRADLLRRFLRFVCEAEIAGRADEITEHTIATEALGRSADYLPGDDSSVRNRAHALRQKLSEYYKLEDPSAPVRIEMRKGSYVPVFVECTPPAEPALSTAAVAVVEPVAAPLPPAPGASRKDSPFVRGVAAGLLGSVLIALGAVAVYSVQARFDPVLQEAWGEMLSKGSPVVVCVGSPPMMLLKSFRDGTVPSTPRMDAAPPWVSEWYAGLQMMDGGGGLRMFTTTNAVLFGDSLAAVRATGLLTRAGAAIQVLPEWGTRPLALRGRNLLLVGSPNYSPYAGRILQKMPLTVRHDAGTKEEVIAETSEAGERVFLPKRDEHNQYSQVYGLLTVLPSHGNGEGSEKTVVFSGITSAGPQAAMEFFASARNMRELKSRLAKEGHQGFPPCYQVVVRSGVDRNLALTWAYETHRVVAKIPSLD